MYHIPTLICRLLLMSLWINVDGNDHLFETFGEIQLPVDILIHINIYDIIFICIHIIYYYYPCHCSHHRKQHSLNGYSWHIFLFAFHVYAFTHSACILLLFLTIFTIYNIFIIFYNIFIFIHIFCFMFSLSFISFFISCPYLICLLYDLCSGY